ncbi:9034_t:CDS:1, partial [Diversispora eburnea]
MAGVSLPENIDTLLVGYLDLMIRIAMEFPLYHDSNHIEEINRFCQEILTLNVKKQLSAKAIEVLFALCERNERNDELSDEVCLK